MSKEKLRRKLRKHVVKLARFAARNDLKHVSIFADLDGGTFIYGQATPFSGEDKAYINEFISDEEVGR